MIDWLYIQHMWFASPCTIFALPLSQVKNLWRKYSPCQFFPHMYHFQSNTAVGKNNISNSRFIWRGWNFNWLAWTVLVIHWLSTIFEQFKPLEKMCAVHATFIHALVILEYIFASFSPSVSKKTSDRMLFNLCVIFKWTSHHYNNVFLRS